MNRALQSWSPRTRPLNYDSLQQDINCQDTSGTQVYSVLPFTRICVSTHDLDPATVFNRSGLLSYTIGPHETGEPPPWVTPWAAWASGVGVRVKKNPGVIVLPAATTGHPSSLYPSGKPTKVSLSFTSEGQIAIAIQKTTQAIEIKWFENDSGVDIGTVEFLGVSPVLAQTAILPHSHDGTQNDLVVFYLRREIPRTIFARVKRDNFEIEYILNQNLQVSVSSLIGIDTDGRKMVLYGRDIFARDVTLYSAEYFMVISGDDKATLTASILRGAYGATAVTPSGGTLEDDAFLTVSIENGSYFDPVQEPGSALSGDAATLSVSILSGEYS